MSRNGTSKGGQAKLARIPRGFPEKYRHCRTFGHQLEVFTPHGKRPALFGFRVSLRCTHCTMERHDLIDALGEVAARQYVPPPGYSLEGSIDRATWRKDYVRRVKRDARAA